PGAQIVFRASNTVLTGGITIDGALPLGFGAPVTFASQATASGLTPSLVGAARVVQHSGAKAAFARAGAPVRRLIVEFKPAAAGVPSSVVAGAALMSRARASMQ